MLRISAVSYINAKPYVYGIEKGGFLKEYSLSLDLPSVCAEKLIKGKVDIGLAPIAIIPNLKEHYIIPDFCIGANGPVRSVMLYSEAPLKEIKSIYLDNQSRTSAMLVQILAACFWKISPQWKEAKKGYEKKINETTAGLIIGDRNFSLTQKYKFMYDLSEEWKLYTGLPFVFACWITNKKLDESVAMAFYNSLRFGVSHTNKAVEELSKQYDEKMILNYLNHNINYNFDAPKQTAMNLFLKLCKKIP